MNLFQELSLRGLVKQVTDRDKVKGLLDNEPMIFYVGFDPTADSLHVGSLLPVMTMLRIIRGGHSAICLIGGGTAMVGDPSGKISSRPMLSKAEIEQNATSLDQQIADMVGRQRIPILGRGLQDTGKVLFVNNADWLADLGYLEFLRTAGTHFRVNEMVKSEAYRLRLEREEGLSLLEFNYQAIQAYDYMILNERFGCSLQIGGDDQWGNIIAGTNLIRKVNKCEAHGLTFPLLTTATGQKMGKTENQTVWLDPNRTSPFEFYQYWMNVDDRDVERFLNMFTFLSFDQIKQVCQEGPDLRVAKKALASEVTEFVHGEDAAKQARLTTESLFEGVGTAAEGIVPETTVGADELGMTIADLVVRTGLTPSKGEANRLIQSGGIYVNSEQVKDRFQTVTELACGKDLLTLRKGKKTFHKVVVRR